MSRHARGGSLRFQRFLLKLLCTVLGLILAAMLFVTVYFQHLMGRINYVEPEDQVTLSQEQLDAYLSGETTPSDPAAPTLDPGSVDFGVPDIQIGGSDVINVLLIGQDRRPGESRARSDSMILCTFNKDTKTLILTSILRDLYVRIPGYQDNRVNVAYAAGGMKLLNDTLEQNFGIQVDGNIEVDFSQFSEIIDLIGGVSMELRADEARHLNKMMGSSLTEGANLLTGEQALQYARIRALDADGDFSRTNRQRKVISAIVEAYKNARLTTILSLLDDILPMITTDMSNLQIIGYALELFPLLSDVTIVSQRIPADGTYSGQMIRGMAVLVADMDATRQLLEETLLGKNG